MKRHRNLLWAITTALAAAAIAAPTSGASGTAGRRRRRLHGRDEHRGDHRRLGLDGGDRPEPAARPGAGSADQLAVAAATTLGAIEFGGNFFEGSGPPAADAVFGPEPVGANAAAMKSALDTKIHADNGGTDYNAAFNTARAANPGAQDRIFLTDGGHDVGTYANTHLNPTPPQTPTYVIGFSAGVSSTEDQARLQQIANDTGGKFFPQTDASQLQSVMNDIEAALTCQTPPQTFTDKLKAGASKIAHDPGRRAHQIAADRADVVEPARQIHDLGPENHEPRSRRRPGRPPRQETESENDDQRNVHDPAGHRSRERAS